MSDENTATAIINEAEALVGEEDGNDYQLRLTGVAALFETSAPTFAALLDESTLTQTARRYQDKDADAVKEQTVFHRLSKKATWSIFTATVATALLSAWAASMPNWAASPSAETVSRSGQDLALTDPVALVLGLVAALASVYATVQLSRLKGGGYLTRWMTERAAAETERLGYFNKLAGLLARKPVAEPANLLLGLELFRRYQLGMQQVYYRQRGRQHRRSMEKTVNLAAIASGVLALGSGVAGIAGAFQPVLLPIAALGIFGAALANVASRREEIHQDERNSERYARTADILDHLREKHSDVQRALAAGKAQVLVDYIHAVHEQLSLEHRQWLSQADAIASAVETLDKSLAEIAGEKKTE